jgi:hypothetical protein
MIPLVMIAVVELLSASAIVALVPAVIVLRTLP